MALCILSTSFRPFQQLQPHPAEIACSKRRSSQASWKANRDGCKYSFCTSEAGTGLIKCSSNRASRKFRSALCRERSTGISISCRASSSQPESDVAPPASPSQFPWKVLLNRMVEKVLSLVEKGIKWVAIPFVAIVLFAELSYSWREGKALLFFIGLVLGTSLATLLKEVYEEIATKYVVGGLPLHIVGLALSFLLMQVPGPAYPTVWLRILLPAIGIGGLWTAGLMLIESRRAQQGISSR